MSGQEWGTCGFCLYRKRLTKRGLLYAHTREVDDPWGARRECPGSQAQPVVGTVRMAPERVSLTKIEKVDVEFDAPWANGKSREDIVNELREIINRGPAPDVIITDDWEEVLGDGFWDRYYWCAVGSVGGLLLLGVAFALGWYWGRR